MTGISGPGWAPPFTVHWSYNVSNTNRNRRGSPDRPIHLFKFQSFPVIIPQLNHYSHLPNKSIPPRIRNSL